MFYVEEPVYGAAQAQLETAEPQEGVTVVAPHLPAAANEDELGSLVERFVRERVAADYVLWLYTPMAVPLIRGLDPRVIVYDCMDELSAFLGAPLNIAELEQELLGRAQLVFTGGRSLYEAKRDRHPSVHLFPSSVDTAHFAAARKPLPEPADQAAIPRPRLGFFGVIDERMDLELIAEVARLRRDWQLVLVGPVVKIEEATLPREPNIHYLGMKDYDELPAYLAGWDVALLPFARNESTRFISPTKTPEYLAAGRPVVSTGIADVIDPYAKAGLVEVANEPNDFVASVERVMGTNGERQRAVDSFLMETSWDYTWADMAELIAAAAGRPRRSAPTRSPGFDAVVVGAGFAGSVLAERLASQLGQRVLVVDRRSHIGGNAYDHYDDAGLLVHRYGPHIFHTNSADVFAYLSQFTEWRPYEHRVLASVDGLLVPIPINLDTVNTLYGLRLTAPELDDFFASIAEPRARVRTMEDAIVSQVGRDLYLKLFRNYTRKQWDYDPSELDAALAARVPTRKSRDARYFTDSFQAMPKHGYTRLFERMLAHPKINVLLNADWREVESLFDHERLVYTGPIDEFFDFRYGSLPYRSLEFRLETHDTERFQPAAVVNYPNEHPYTRVTEFKWLTGQEHRKTTVVYEYPRAEGDPYYPVPRPENEELYKEYKALAATRDDVTFVGRLATYRYYNMDQVVAQALAAFKRLRDGGPSEEARDLDRALAAETRAMGGAGVHGRARRR